MIRDDGFTGLALKGRAKKKARDNKSRGEWCWKRIKKLRVTNNSCGENRVVTNTRGKKSNFRMRRGDKDATEYETERDPGKSKCSNNICKRFTN